MNSRSLFYLSFFLLFIVVSTQTALAQKPKKNNLWKSLNTPSKSDTAADDYYGNNIIRYEDYVYKKNIKTIELRDESFVLAKAILSLGSEEKLKLSGELPMTDLEKINFKLDELYPNAKSKTIVEYEGVKYQVRYFPAQTSRSGKTVQEWANQWSPIKKE